MHNNAYNILGPMPFICVPYLQYFTVYTYLGQQSRSSDIYYFSTEQDFNRWTCSLVWILEYIYMYVHNHVSEYAILRIYFPRGYAILQEAAKLGSKLAKEELAYAHLVSGSYVLHLRI